jgi:methylthioribose-1-phosphate isomerase
MDSYFTIRWVDGKVRMLDQRLLPHQIKYVDFETPSSVAFAIKNMVIRGAPAIGVAAAYGLALAANASKAGNKETFIAEMADIGNMLKNARPTAVNLTWAVDRMLEMLERLEVHDIDLLRAAFLHEAVRMSDQDVQANRQMGQHALAVIPENATIIHHCNTGSLATVEYGTALGAIRAAHESGLNIHVYVDETRPRLQGARLTTWELKQLGIPHTLIVDGASGFFMSQGKIDLCMVGCDRVAANGDTANKIGTYNLALVAKAHQIPFYVVGPTSTVDLNLRSGQEIPIEERSPSEITDIEGCLIPPDGTKAANPAFDITPARFITAIITERGIAFPPFEQSLARLSAA